MSEPRDLRLHRRPSAEDARRLQELAELDAAGIEQQAALDEEQVRAWLHDALLYAQRSGDPTRMDVLVSFCLAGAVRCLVGLRTDLLDDDRDHGADLRALAIELRPHGAAWDGAARLATWGYLCEFAARHIDGDFGQVLALAEHALPLEPGTAEQLVAIGPLSTREPELFGTRLTRLIVREARGPDDLATALRLRDTAWPAAWDAGWQTIWELHEHQFGAGSDG
jgi:hypothetical protein